MVKTLRISEDLSLPIDAVTQKLAFLGRTGSGKTYAAMKMVEQMLEAGAQVVALDPVGVWHGLRMGPQPFSIPVFGGLHGDVPLQPQSGALIADLIVDRGISAVLDVSQMIPSEMHRFSTDFAARFFHRKKSSPSAVHLPIEECQEFIPQNPMKGEEKMLHEFQRLQKLGRNFGIGVSLISQRPQEVSKKALNQTECVFAFQMTGPQERKTLAGWVQEKGLDIDVQSLLPKLKVGTAHVWSPQWLDFAGSVHIAQKRTPDVSATPKVGASSARKRELSPIDLEQLGKEMTETIERAKADDPKELRAQVAAKQKRIAELERDVAALTAKLEHAQNVKPTKPGKDVPVIRDKDIAALERALSRMEKAIEANAVGTESLRAAAGLLNEATKRARTPAPAARIETTSQNGTTWPAAALQRPGTQPVAHRAPARPVVHRDVKPGEESDTEVVAGALRQLLVALAQRPFGLTTNQIRVRADLSTGSSTWRNNLAKARKNGWIVESGDLKAITDDGLVALGAFESLPTGSELRDYWIRKFGESAIVPVLRAAIEAFPGSLTTEELGESAGVSTGSSTWRNNLARLRNLQLLITTGSSHRASEELFDSDRRQAG